MIQLRTCTLTAALLGLMPAVGALSAQSGKPPVNQYGNPMKLAPSATSAEISEKDLRTRLYQFADDSMMGRGAGTLGNQKATDFLAAEAKRLGLEPAGDNGTYFQALPFGMRFYNAESQLSAAGQQLRWGSDFAGGAGPVIAATFQNAQVVFGGIVGDTARQIASHLAVGRFVILLPDPNATAGGGRGGRGGGGGGRGGRGGAAPVSRFAGAAAVATADLDALSPAQLAALTRPPIRSTLNGAVAPGGGQPPAPGTVLGPPPGPPAFRVTRAAAEQLMGVSVAGLQLGAAGRTTTGRLVVTSQLTPTYGRNVVAILRGSDPTLSSEFVVIGAHNDHEPLASAPVDHDSLRAVLSATYAKQMADGKTVQTISQETRQEAISKIDFAAVRAASGPARMDSVRNGADDDGSGSMAVMEIAEALSMSKVKPKRSVVFIWHTGEETGLQGSRFYADNPTVPINSIVANINIDMIGRGRADDIPGGGPDYLAVVGSKMLSTDLGNMVVAANKQQKKPLKLDYAFDDSTTWAGYNNIYGRSDHANYARKGIPIAFFFTGLHRDYHQLTDEPQYIDYPHYSRITNYIRDLLVDIGNAPKRPAVDKRVVQ